MPNILPQILFEVLTILNMPEPVQPYEGDIIDLKNYI